MRILLVEDEAELADLIALGLRNESYAVDVARTVGQATELALVTTYDIVCLDLGLPDGDGLDFCRELVSGAGLCVPRRILILTARDAVAQRVAGLDAGADDYLVKPFEFTELIARLRALNRREDQRSTLVSIADLTMDLSTHRVERSGRRLDLTAREFSLLRYFVHHPDMVLSAEQLLEHVWDAHADPMTTSVRVILSRLRKKLGEPPLIATETGAGYRLVST